MLLHLLQELLRGVTRAPDDRFEYFQVRISCRLPLVGVVRAGAGKFWLETAVLAPEIGDLVLLESFHWSCLSDCWSP